MIYFRPICSSDFSLMSLRISFLISNIFFFFNDTATTEIYTLSLHDALPISFHFRGTERDVFLLSASSASDFSKLEAEFGSTEYAKEILGHVWGYPPALDLKEEAALQKCLRELIGNHDLESAHDCSEGGLAVALAESAFPSGVGAEIDLASNVAGAERVPFDETTTPPVLRC